MRTLRHVRLWGHLTACAAMITLLAACSSKQHNGSFGSLDNLYRLSSAQTRSICPENFTGEKGKAGMATEGTGKNAARDLGQTWKVSPSVAIKAKTTFTMATITGSGCIQHIWMTPTGNWRQSIMRVYWDDETEPSIECPVGDFFACGLGQYAQINSLAVCVNPGSAFNCYWPMPFRKSARITMENTDDKDMVLYYQVDYALTQVPADAAYLHAQFRREDPLKAKGLYTILDGVKGKGQYVGTYMAWEVHSPGWWGEGEIKFFLDGDKDFPTIAGTGTEDYFCGSYNFENRQTKKYQTFSTPYTGLAQVLPPDKIYEVGQRFSLYRWHITDPIRFDKDLRVTIQALGWQDGGRYLQLNDDISSIAFWYQTEPHAHFPPLPPREKMDW
ncbi:MAG TPA: glycoside hydrolase family 172 protein [Tepidisphaeraceae bacterium]|nr:glycoside hydrolase family 172 protein [Tepidisphaeraceae bacterium]